MVSNYAKSKVVNTKENIYIINNITIYIVCVFIEKVHEMSKHKLLIRLNKI